MPAKPLNQIDTIAIVMMENRSFDHMLGFLSHEAFDGRAGIDGLHLHSADFDWDNPDDAGKLYTPTATPDGFLPADLPHSRSEVDTELAKKTMLGFIKAYFATQNTDRTPVPMRFCRPVDVPVTAALARGYSVCDRWHASLPDDTFPNRLMSLSGYTRIDATSVVKPPFGLMPDQTTLFDWLVTKGKTFGIYVDAEPIVDVGPPSSLLMMKSQWTHVVHNGHALSALAGKWKSKQKAPDVLYIEPFFNDFATALGLHGNCNHPPLPVAYGEDFLNRVYTILTSDREKWKRTMMIICYDEHGGFFDHVAPPAMKYAPPKDHKWSDKTPFKSLGVRVPGIVVSPLVDPGKVFHELLDHTSILQLLVDKFGKPNDLAFFGDAAARKASGVASLARTLTRSTPRDDIPTVPAAPPPNFPFSITPPISNVGQIFRQVIAAKPAKQV